MSQRVRAWVGLGANLGDARATIDEAFTRLAALPDTELAARSSVYRTAPVDASGPDFLNAVAGIDTALDAPTLLAALHAIESDHGRARPYHHAPRTLDLDLLLHGDLVLQTPSLTVPHPRLHLRAFVLAPLLELAPDLVHPLHGRLDGWLARAAGQAVARLPG